MHGLNELHMFLLPLPTLQCFAVTTAAGIIAYSHMKYRSDEEKKRRANTHVQRHMHMHAQISL